MATGKSERRTRAELFAEAVEEFCQCTVRLERARLDAQAQRAFAVARAELVQRAVALPAPILTLVP